MMGEISITIDRNERDWLLKRVLDAIGEVHEEPGEAEVDRELLEFLERLRGKLSETRKPHHA